MKTSFLNLFKKKEKGAEGGAGATGSAWATGVIGVIGASASEYKNAKTQQLKSLIDFTLKHPSFFKTKGIFRISPKAEDLKKATLDPEVFISSLAELSEEDLQRETHIICGLLKHFFKEALDDPDRKQIQQALSLSFSKVNVSDLPSPFQCLLSVIASTLDNQEVNMMTSNNLAVVFYPHIYKTSTDLSEIPEQKKGISDFFENHCKALVSSKSTQVLPVNSEEGKLEEACGGQAQDPQESPLTPKMKKKILFD